MACGTHGRGKESVQGFGGKAQRKETTRKTQGIDGRMDSERILGRLAEGCGLDLTGSEQGLLATVTSAVINLWDFAPWSYSNFITKACKTIFILYFFMK
jgi:hypothetical protein